MAAEGRHFLTGGARALAASSVTLRRHHMAATLSDLEQQNPNIRSQIETWQQARTDNGQAPTDWNAFRQHAMAIGAPDPGQEEPREFMQSAAAAESKASSIKLQAQQVQASPQQVQASPQQVQ